MYRSIVSLIIVMTGALVTNPHAFADDAVFRWVDEDGIVHFGDRVPEGVNAVEFTLKPNRVELTGSETSAGSSPDPETAVDAGANARGEAELSNAEQRRQSRAERRQKYTADKQKMESQCETMRRQKEFIEPHPRVLVQDENGNPRRLEDSEREEMLNEANAFLAENCKNLRYR